MGRRPSVGFLAVGWVVVVTLLQASSLWAGERTDTVDAMDEAINDPFDIHIEPSFHQRIERGTIIREANCSPNPDDPGFINAERCPDEATVIFNRELDYERVVSQLDFDIQIGMWRDLEFHIMLPIIFSDQRVVEFATGSDGDVSQANSSVDPADQFIIDDLEDGGTFDTYRFFSVDGVGNGPARSGFGDMVLGISFEPFNQERSSHLASMKLTFDYMAPTGEIARRDNSGVGRGVHELRFGVDASRRFGIAEPYVSLVYALPLFGSESLFEDFGGGQVTQGPGQRAEFAAGAELVAYENTEREQLFTVDLGFDFAYHAEGRDYNPLFDVFGGSECNGTTPREADFDLDGRLYEPSTNTPPRDAACAWVLQQPSNVRRNPQLDDLDLQYFHDGILTVEDYIIIGAHIAANFQISPYVEIRIRSLFETETEHFLTSSRTGRDRDGDDEVDFNDPNERNPVYNPTLDGVGNRLRAQSVLNIEWDATLAFQF